MSTYGSPEYPIAVRQTNGLAIAGFICAIIGLFTGGVVSILGLVLSLIALKDEPRGFAWAGIIVSLLGFCLGAIVIFAFGTLLLAALGIATVAMANFADPIKIETTADMAMIVAKAEETKRDSGYPPASLTALGLDSEVLTDPWGNPYRYILTDATERGFEIISDGPDGQPETADDVEFSDLDQMWGDFSGVTVTTTEEGPNAGSVTIRAGRKTFTIRGDQTGGAIIVDDGERTVEIIGGPDGSIVRSRDSRSNEQSEGGSTTDDPSGGGQDEGAGSGEEGSGSGG